MRLVSEFGKLKHDELLSSCAITFNLHRYSKGIHHFKGAGNQAVLGSKPCMVFLGDRFETDPGRGVIMRRY
jgi:hypothetical protein